MLTGDDYFDSNEFRDLLKSYEESVRSGVPIFLDTDDLTDIADYYQLIGNNISADKAIDNALEIDSGAVLPLIFKIRQALQNCDIKSAKQYFCQITDKDNPDYKFIKAFGNIEHLLQNLGYIVYTTKHDSFGTIENNAIQLKKYINQ